MSRSQKQLATVYAPGALFTWEGGLGSCRSVAFRTDETTLPISARRIIREQIQEFLEGWLQAGLRCRDSLDHEVDPRQSVDQSVLRDEAVQATEDKFTFVEASMVGYEPFPLAFACRRCGLYRSCDDVTKLAGESPGSRQGARAARTVPTTGSRSTSFSRTVRARRADQSEASSLGCRTGHRRHV